MDFVTVLAAVSQFHLKLDELVKNQVNMQKTIAKLQLALDVVVDEMVDWRNRFSEVVKLDKIQKRLDSMSIDDEKVPSSNPST